MPEPTASLVITMPPSAITMPQLKSMPAVRMMSVWPMARVPVMAVCWVSVPRLRGVAKLLLKKLKMIVAMNLINTLTALVLVYTAMGLPLAILTFVLEQRKERQNEEEEIFQRLSDEYREFLKLVLDNADLHLLRREGSTVALTAEQEERRHAIFGILISLFERAYLLVYEPKMSKQTRRLWQSWEDYMREWVRRADFRDALPTLLEGEDEEFTHYISELVSEEEKAP